MLDIKEAQGLGTELSMDLHCSILLSMRGTGLSLS